MYLWLWVELSFILRGRLMCVVIKILPLGTMNVCIKFHGNLSSSCTDISVWTNWPADRQKEWHHQPWSHSISIAKNITKRQLGFQQVQTTPFYNIWHSWNIFVFQPNTERIEIKRACWSIRVCKLFEFAGKKCDHTPKLGFTFVTHLVKLKSTFRLSTHLLSLPQLISNANCGQ